MNVSITNINNISKITSSYFYFGSSYKNILNLKKNSKHQLINYKGELSKIFKREEFFFLNWIEKKRNQNNDSIYWWMNQIAGRNNLSSNFFLYICQYHYIIDYLQNKKLPNICIVCENQLLQNFLYKNLKKKYKCKNFVSLWNFFYEKLFFTPKKIFKFFKGFTKILVAITFSKLTKPKKINYPEQDIILFHHCVNSSLEKVKKPQICNYFLDLPNLIKKKKKLKVFSLFWTYSGYFSLKFYKSMRENNSFVPEDWLFFSDYIKIFFSLKKIRLSLIKPLNYKKNLDVSLLLTQEREEQDFLSCFKFLMYIPALKRWSKKIKKLIIFDQYQNMTFEHPLRFASKDLKIQTKTIGYHHSLMSKEFLGYRGLSSEWKSKSRPDKVFTIGKFARRMLISGGIPSKKIIETFSLRQQKHKKSRRRNNKRNILLILPLKKDLSIEVCEKIKLINEKLIDLNFKIFVKTHPFLGNRELLNNLSWGKLPINWFWAEKDLKVGLDKCFLVVTSSSAAVYDAILRGKIPIILDSDLNSIDNYLDIFEQNKTAKNLDLIDLPNFFNNIISNKSLSYLGWIKKIQKKLINGINSRSNINEKRLVKFII